MRVSLILLVVSCLLSSSLAQTISNSTTNPTAATATEAPTTKAPTTLPTLVPANATATAPTNAPTTLPTLVPANATAAAPTNAPTTSLPTLVPSNRTGGASPSNAPTLFAPTIPGLVATPANLVCYQEVVATQGSFAQIDASLKAWSQNMYQTLNLTGPIELSVGWARVPDRTGFENGCTGPFPNIADLFVHIQANPATFDSIASALESFIEANRMTSQPNIACSARSIITYVPGCGKVTGGAGINNGTISPPTNSTTALPTLVPGNGTAGAPPSNSTSSTASSSNSTSSTSSSSNSTSSTSSSSNSTSTAGSSTPSNSSSSGSGSGSGSSVVSSSSISSNSTTGNGTGGSNSTIPTIIPVGGASQDAGASGGVSVGAAHTTATMTTGTMSVILLVSIVGIML